MEPADAADRCQPQAQLRGLRRHGDVLGSGPVKIGFDGLDRPFHTERAVGSTVESIDATTRFSPSGLILGQTLDAGNDVTLGYDGDGRTIALGTYWQAVALDAAGRGPSILGEFRCPGAELNHRHADFQTGLRNRFP